jgi:hypothetical protein
MTSELRNILARLYKSAPAVPATNSVIDAVLEIVAAEKPAKTTENESATSSFRIEIRGASLDPKQAEQPVSGAVRNGEARNGIDDNAKEDSEASSFGAIDSAAYDERLASASTSDDINESLPEHTVQLNQAQDSRQPKQFSVPLSLSLSPSNPPSPPPDKKQKAVLTAAGVASSSFLPSLSNVGYLSGSESEASDIDDHVAPRKNRRGQRARQAIWEKKYGEKAKHVTEPKNNRDEGWDAKRGAVSKDDLRSRTNSKFSKAPPGRERAGNPPVATLARNQKSSATKKDDTGPLHPSWEAAKRAKEQKLAATFQGKRLTFD